MPAMGVRPPAFTLAAVRAMAPVAGMPPKSTEAMLPTPWATSSMLARWCPLIIESATTEVKGWKYYCDENSEVTHLRELPKSVRVYEINGPMFFGIPARNRGARKHSRLSRARQCATWPRNLR